MKKIIILLSALFFSVGAFAAEEQAKGPQEIEEGKQYITLPYFISPEKEVIEFFSFNCGSCYMFDHEYKGSNTILANVPEGTIIKKYHLDNFGPLSEELAEAWAIANVLDIKEEVSEALYNGIQKNKTIKSANDIRNVFIDLGIPGDEFDDMRSNFLVTAFISQQKTSVAELKPRSIPAFIVNGKYFINSYHLDQTSNESSIKDYSRVINYILETKDK